MADLRTQADDVARQIRELDTDIQRTNWAVDLLADGMREGRRTSTVQPSTPHR